MSDTTTAAAGVGTVQLSNGQAISYKAYARKFQPGQAAVLYLVATCYYPTGGWHIFFEDAGGDNWKLMEKVPGIVNQLVTYYVASGTTSQPLASPPSSVTITDGSGSHTVPVEAWQLEG